MALPRARAKTSSATSKSLVQSSANVGTEIRPKPDNQRAAEIEVPRDGLLAEIGGREAPAHESEKTRLWKFLLGDC